MKKEELDQLLAKYYEGETTPDEEELLLRFGNEASDEGQGFDQAWFGYLKNAKNNTTQLENPEKYLDIAIEKSSKRNHNRKYVFTFSGIAAGIAILTGLFLFSPVFNEPEVTQTNEYVLENPELAYMETKKALLKVSETLNKGTDQLAEIDKLNKNTEKLNKVVLFNIGMVQLTKFKHIPEKTNINN